MHERPAGVSDADVAAALREHWNIPAAGLRYLPVGFGGHHWSATGPAGQRWFVTLSEVADEEAFADLAATMTAAATLAACPGLDFVVAPARTPTGHAAARIRPGWAATVCPFADGEPGHWGDELTAAGHAEVVGMLAAVHGCEPPPGTPTRSPDLPGRDTLGYLLRKRAGSWAGAGPYGAAAQELVTGHAAGLRRALAAFDDLAAQVAVSGGPVLTHGEPHPGNLIRRGDRFLLIDWDTAGLAAPERDLWWVLPDPAVDPGGYAAVAARYGDLTGREVSAPAVRRYRLRWDLDDICQFLADFRAPHERTADTEVAWAGLEGAVRRVAAGPP